MQMECGSCLITVLKVSLSSWTSTNRLNTLSLCQPCSIASFIFWCSLESSTISILPYSYRICLRSPAGKSWPKATKPSISWGVACSPPEGCQMKSGSVPGARLKSPSSCPRGTLRCHFPATQHNGQSKSNVSPQLRFVTERRAVVHVVLTQNGVRRYWRRAGGAKMWVMSPPLADTLNCSRCTPGHMSWRHRITVQEVPLHHWPPVLGRLFYTHQWIL